MSRKIIHLLRASTLFLVITAAITPLANTVTWSAEIQLTTDSHWDIIPSIVQMNDGTIWVVWQSDRGPIGTYFNIFYTIYDWSSWSDPMPLTTDSSDDVSASVMQTNDGTIWLFWASNRAGGNYNIFYKTSSDNGVTWSNTTQLTNSGFNLLPSTIQATNGTIWVVWQSNTNGSAYDLFYTTSSDNGSSWTNATQLTTNVHNDEYPSITQMRDGTIWVVWQYYIDPPGPDSDFEIFYKTYNGSWSNDTRLTEDTCFDWDPSIMQARDGAIWVFWSRELQKGATPPQEPYQDDLFYKISVDNGATWSEDIQLTTSEDCDEDSPSAAQISDKKIWLTWESNKNDSRPDIYYQTSSEVILHDVAITSVTPSSTMVNQSETVSISVTAENEGEENETFTVDCYANTTLIGSENATPSPENSTTIVFSWDTSGFAPGPYTITANASTVLGEHPINLDDNTFTDGTVTIIIHDVAITNVTLSSPSVYPGNPLNIYVEAKNEGTVDETFNVTTYANSTTIQTLTFTDLAPNDNITLIFTWNTTSVSLGNYPISATAETIPGETDTGDNTYINGTVLITIPGDADGDGNVDFEDFVIFAATYGISAGEPGYDPRGDLNFDGEVDFDDFVIFAGKYGKSI